MAEQKKRGSAGKSGGGNSSLMAILAVVALVAVGGVLWSVRGSAGGNTATAPVDLGEIDDRALLSLARGVEAGASDADIWILEFADFQCPACQSFAQTVKPLLELNYISAGKIRFVYHDFPLTNIHPNAFLAARAGRCADDQGRFWDFHDLMYGNQRQWSGQANPIGNFVGYGETVGLDKSAFEACLRSDRHADVVSANMRLGMALGVPGTPSVMIRQGSGIARRLGSSDYNTIATAIDEALAALAPSPGS